MIYTATSVQPGGLKKPIPEAVKAVEEEAKYLIMFDLPPDHANIVETYIKNKENLAIACGDHPVKEEVEQKATKGKGKKKGKAGKCHQPCFHRQSVNMISSIVESGSTSSQISKSTKPSSDDTLASVIQRLDTLQTSNEQLRELNNKLVEKSAGWGSSIAKLEKELGKERDDRKAERNSLEERLGKERDIRKAERNSLEERLGKEKDIRKAERNSLEERLGKERDDRKAERNSLEERLAKERDDRKAEKNSLEERLKEQDRSYTERLEEQDRSHTERLEKLDRSYTAKLAAEREARKRDIQSISEVRALPKHCPHYRPFFFWLSSP